MENSICGITCTLDNSSMGHFLKIISHENYIFYIPWCSKIDKENSLRPDSRRDYYVSNQELRDIAEDTIWELELQIYPQGVMHDIFDTYDSFRNSNCICSIIFYDCMELEIYVKSDRSLEKIYNMLSGFGAERIHFLTCSSQMRQVIHL